MDRECRGSLLPRFFYTGVVSVARSIYLVGMMGVGKSTVGPLLAARLGREFVDTDQEIERRTGRSVADIFDREGEAAFRRHEAEAVEAASSEPAVIALGGGAIVQPGALERLSDRGDLVYLRASAEILLERIADPSSRPLLSGLSESECTARLQALLEERRPFYERARFQIDADGTGEEVVDRIVARLEADA